MLFITDIDGTLLDSAKSISSSAIETIVKFSGIELTHQYFLPYIGTPIRDVLKEYIEDLQLDAAVIFFREKLIIYGAIETKVMPFAIQVLNQLRNSGVTICAATNKHTILAEQVLAQHGLSSHFSKIYGSDFYAPKPSPAMILAAKADFPAHQVYMLGDRPEDVMAAKHAGITSIYISNECDYLISDSSAQPDFTITSWLEIFEIQTIREAISIK
jgi:HAD superfamily hydrolase (TIGR01509 family)